MTARTLRRTVTAVVLVGMALVATALLGPRGDGPPLDPRSTGPTGAAALLETLEDLGADVRIGARPAEGTDVVVVLADGLDPAARARLLEWTQAGGRLVLADPFSPLTVADAALEVETTGVLDTSVVGPVPVRPACDLAALDDVEVVRASRYHGLVGTEPVAGDATGRRCFPVADGWWLLVEPLGRGTVVVLGGADVWTNQRLADADNAVLAAALLAPEPNTELLVAVGEPGDRPGGLAELVPDGVRHALWWLVGAFLVVAWWRGRRLGAPVDEELPVAFPASELVRAVGELLQRSANREEAARLLAEDLRLDLAAMLGTDPALPVEALAERVAARTGHDTVAVAATLQPAPPEDDDALLELARRIARVRQAVRSSTAGG